MSREAIVAVAVGGLMAGWLSASAEARVVRIVVDRTTPYSSG
mgnify:CR=1 FL=1